MAAIPPDWAAEITGIRIKEALQRAVALGSGPDLNGEVFLNITPLHEMVPWREAKKCWDELTQGQYEWSTISQRLRHRGLVRTGAVPIVERFIRHGGEGI